MDFEFSDDEQAIRDLAGQIFRELASHERQRELERQGPERFDSALWSALAEAGILGTAIPETHGGAGLGFFDLAGVFEEVGRTTAPVPIFETLVLGALPLAEFGPEAIAAEWLPRVAGGEAILTGAFGEGPGDAALPGTRAIADGAGFRLEGTKRCVSEAPRADAMIVSAATDDGGILLAWVPREAEGVALEPVADITGRAQAHVVFSGTPVPVEHIVAAPGAGAEALASTLDWANAAQAAIGLGLAEAALELTSDYVKTRKQFDQPIAMFQAVGHRAADAYIDVEGIRWTTLQAAWRLGQGLDASKEIAVAKHWVAEAGARVVAAGLHLHGGVGVDKEYPLHRYYLLAKHLELQLGGSTRQLLKLGRLLAEEPATA